MGCIGSGLLGWMALLSIPLDTISFICLTMSIGFSVDYVIHVAHFFGQAIGTPRERAVEALVAVGGSLAKAGMTDFLGMALIGTSNSEACTTPPSSFLHSHLSLLVASSFLPPSPSLTTHQTFQTFFHMFAAIVILGLFGGLAFFPAAASLVGRWVPSERSSHSDHIRPSGVFTVPKAAQVLPPKPQAQSPEKHQPPPIRQADPPVCPVLSRKKLSLGDTVPNPPLKMQQV